VVNDEHRQRLMRQVALRQQAAAVGVRCFRWAVGVAAAGVLWLLCSRTLGLWPERLLSTGSLTGFAMISLGVLAAMAFRRRPAASDTARLIDRQTSSQDLFLTAAMIDRSPGAYRPLVLGQAEQKAASIKPSQVLPMRWQRRAQWAAFALILLVSAGFWLPSGDPFGRTRQRNQIAQRREQLEKSRQATVLRVAALQKAGDEKRVEQAISALEQTFQQAKPVDKEANLRRLSEHQKELGQLWRQVSDAEWKKTLETSRVEQSFGRPNSPQAERWKEALRKGDVSELKRELNRLQEHAARAAAQPEGAQKQQERDQLQRQLGALSEALKEMQAPGLNAALNRALDQLAQGRTPQLSSNALKAAGESLGLSAKELEALARAMGDMKSLEDALKSTQLAKQLNGMGELDGREAAECKGIGDYADLYARVLGRKAVGKGMGPKPGLGAGGPAQENGSAKTAYQPEKSPTALTPGKLLMQWKTNENSEPGQARQDYLSSLEQVKQDVSEAIVQEQVPPGYHQAIQKYFDTLPLPGVNPPSTGQ
jgi:hypothetical protein